MYNQKMMALGESRSVIRDLAEYGSQLAKEIGSENVFDFSIGNPSVPTPDAINLAISNRIATDKNVHAYTSAQGLLWVREKIADFNKKTYGLPISAQRMYLTCGASAALAIALKAAITAEQPDVVVLAPYFPEYKVFIENADGNAVVVPTDEVNFQIDFDALQAALSPKTAAVVINSPNNPSGIVYSSETLSTLANVLKVAEKRFGNVIVLISDEPYREIVFDAPFISPIVFYDDSVLCYSYSKSFSLPGERIGYLAVSDRLFQADAFYSAVLGAGRALGYICAPSLLQKVVADCICQPSNIAPYKENREILVEALRKAGFEVVNPQGAFYILMKAPNGDANAFADQAKKVGLLFVPTDSFGLKGYLRIATCVSKEMILRALPVISTFAKQYFATCV